MGTEILKGVVDIDADRVCAMAAKDDARSLCLIKASIKPVEGDSRRSIVSGSIHNVMRLIGVLADHRDACLASAFTTEQAEALDAAAAYVELYTSNGTRKQPPTWAMDSQGQFLADVVADRARAAAFGYQS